MTDPTERAASCCMTSGDIARLLGVDLKTIHNWVRHDHLHGRRTKGGHLRFHRTEVVRFMRRFGYPIPEVVGLSVPRVLLVGIPAASGARPRALYEYITVESYDGLFDAALVVASGDYEVLALDIDLFGIERVVDLLTALRRRPLTQGVAIVGRSANADFRERFVDAGGDVVIVSQAELGTTVRWLTGASTPQHAERSFAVGAS